MPQEQQQRFGVQMDPHARAGGQMGGGQMGGGQMGGGQMGGGQMGGGQMGGAQPGGMRPVSPMPTDPGPPRPIRSSEGGGTWIAPGDRVNPNRPEEACPLCGRNDFATVTDLEIHCAQCTGS